MPYHIYYLFDNKTLAEDIEQCNCSAFPESGHEPFCGLEYIGTFGEALNPTIIWDMGAL